MDEGSGDAGDGRPTLWVGAVDGEGFRITLDSVDHQSRIARAKRRLASGYYDTMASMTSLAEYLVRKGILDRF